LGGEKKNVEGKRYWGKKRDGGKRGEKKGKMGGGSVNKGGVRGEKILVCTEREQTVQPVTV